MCGLASTVFVCSSFLLFSFYASTGVLHSAKPLATSSWLMSTTFCNVKKRKKPKRIYILENGIHLRSWGSVQLEVKIG